MLKNNSRIFDVSFETSFDSPKSGSSHKINSRSASSVNSTLTDARNLPKARGAKRCLTFYDDELETSGFAFVSIKKSRQSTDSAYSDGFDLVVSCNSEENKENVENFSNGSSSTETAKPTLTENVNIGFLKFTQTINIHICQLLKSS